MGSFAAFVGKDADQVDAAEGKAFLDAGAPELLQEGEEVILAFLGRGGKGRDRSFFTDKRIILIDKHGMTGKKTEYLSVPYASIKAFSIESAGFAGSDSDMKITASGIGVVKLSFMKKVDIFALKLHLSRYVLAGDRAGAEGAVAADADKVKLDSANFLDWFGDNSAQVDASKVEEQLKSKTNILLPDETIEMAFKLGRDSFLMTSKRIMKIDVQGMSGKKTEYLSILWGCVRAFSIETAGRLDNDAELIIFTNVPGMTRIEFDLRKGKADIFAVNLFFADKILGLDTVDPSENAKEKKGWLGFGSSGGGMMSWMGDDSKMIDAEKMNSQYHSSPPILQNCETVEMAFKGRRDLMLFTTKRIVLVDLQGWSGKSVNYISIPWKTVVAFGVTSAGPMDKDSEVMIWTDFDDIINPPKENEGDPIPPPIPRNSFLEFDLQKDNVDLMAIKRYLGKRCLRVDGGQPLPSDVPVSPDFLDEASKTSAMQNVMTWIGGDAKSIDVDKLNVKLHAEIPILQNDENVILAYKGGRDMMMFTSRRVLIMDKKGMSGKSTEWMTIPYASIRAFSVESAGGWDKDAEAKIFCKVYWMNGKPGNVIEQDFRKGKADVIAVQHVLATKVMGAEDGSTTVDEGATAEGAGAAGNFLTWVSDDGVEMNPDAVNEKLHTSPPILLADESVDACYKIGRDMCIFTTKRVLFLDRQGMTGKKVEYMSYPLRYCKAFKLLSAGGMLSSAEAIIYTDVPGASKIKQEIRKGSNIWGVQKLLATKILR